MPMNFWTMCKDGENGGFEDYWVEVCIDGREEAAAIFSIRVPAGDDPKRRVKQLGELLATTEPQDGIIIADVLDPGWRDRPKPSVSNDPDIPF